MPESPAERTLRCRKAALTRSVTTDGATISAPARAARLQRFYDQTDPALPEKERQRRAAAALRLQMTNVSIAALKARGLVEAAAAAAQRLAEQTADAAGQL